jgi:hypothetical protein
MSFEPLPGGRRIWAALELLDHQIVDVDGRLAGKVDDLEFANGEDPATPPELTAVCSGLGALAGQIGGDLGAWLRAIEVRLAPSERHSGRIATALVGGIGEHVEVTVAREALPSNRAEAWARDVVVSKIPGAGHAPD